jgi:exosome complex component CSL4
MPLIRKDGEIVIPGDDLGSADAYESGFGTYISDGKLRASMAGSVTIDNDVMNTFKPRMNIVTIGHNSSQEMVIEIGDVVLARVLRISVNFANVEILSIGENGKVLQLPPKAVIRREDIRLNDIDSLVVHECFRPGDIVRAVVISLGDARQYFLSTADVEFGVVIAKSEKSQQRLVPVSARVSFQILCFPYVADIFMFTGNGGSSFSDEGATESSKTRVFIRCLAECDIKLAIDVDNYDKEIKLIQTMPVEVCDFQHVLCSIFNVTRTGGWCVGRTPD